MSEIERLQVDVAVATTLIKLVLKVQPQALQVIQQAFPKDLEGVLLATGFSDAQSTLFESRLREALEPLPGQPPQ